MFKTISVFGYIGMVGGLLGLLAIQAVFSTSILVIGVQIASVVLLVWARITFGWRSFHVVANPTVGGLIRTGPYKYIPHPIYTSVCLFSWAGVVVHWSAEAWLLGIVVLASALARMFAEERLVVVRYPEYADYAAHTWRMIPYVY